MPSSGFETALSAYGNCNLVPCILWTALPMGSMHKIRNKFPGLNLTLEPRGRFRPCVWFVYCTDFSFISNSLGSFSTFFKKNLRRVNFSCKMHDVRFRWSSVHVFLRYCRLFTVDVILRRATQPPPYISFSVHLSLSSSCLTRRWKTWSVVEAPL